jgi:hypothetical protein
VEDYNCNCNCNENVGGRQVPRGGAAVQARAVHPRGRAGPRPPRRGQAAQQPRAALPEPGTPRSSPLSPLSSLLSPLYTPFTFTCSDQNYIVYLPVTCCSICFIYVDLSKYAYKNIFEYEYSSIITRQTILFYCQSYLLLFCIINIWKSGIFICGG